MGRSFLKFIAKECDPSLAQDRSLPYTAYLVEYLQDGLTKFDIVSSTKQVEIFDYYWDLYRYDFIKMTQTEGRISPKLWVDPNEPKKGKKK
jgi:hypothetical protein